MRFVGNLVLFSVMKDF